MLEIRSTVKFKTNSNLFLEYFYLAPLARSIGTLLEVRYVVVHYGSRSVQNGKRKYSLPIPLKKKKKKLRTYTIYIRIRQLIFVYCLILIFLKKFRFKNRRRNYILWESYIEIDLYIFANNFMYFYIALSNLKRAYYTQYNMIYKRFGLLVYRGFNNISRIHIWYENAY